VKRDVTLRSAPMSRRGGDEPGLPARQIELRSIP